MDIYETIITALKNFDLKNDKVRLVGVKTSNLSDDDFTDNMFSETDITNIKKENLHKAIDKIKSKYGSRSIGFRE